MKNEPAPRRTLRVTRRQYNARRCFVCGLDNPFGLRARFYETGSGELVALCTPDERHQSYPHHLHGGIASALLDETIGRAISVGSAETVWGVTMELTLKYRRPVPYGEEIKVVGRIDRDRGRLFEGSGEIVLPDGTVAVTARGLFMKQRADQIAGDAFVEDEWGFTTDEPLPETIEL